MATPHLNLLLQQIRRFSGSPSEQASDGHLLERFCVRREESAFAALVRRHGAMVFGLCRRVLHHEHDAEDVFQATFLVLARKAASLRPHRSLGGWLHEVAYHLALRARERTARRQRIENEVRSMTPREEPALDVCRRELRSLLDEELRQLPAKYREPLILCYLEGKTNEQAAHQLGWPIGSMSRRLERGRELLRQRLLRRGVALPAGVLAAVLVEEAASAAVPPLLASSVVRMALQTSVSAIPASVATLVEERIREMFLHKLRLALVVSLMVVGLGAGALAYQTNAAQPGEENSSVPPAQAGEQPPSVARTKGAGPDGGANAASEYGQAYIALRRGLGDQEKLITECLTMPLGARARELVTKGAYALRMVQRGAARPRCDWAIDFDCGIEVSYTHADGAQLLSSLACLRARLRFQEGKNADAIEDIVAAMTLARHISRDGTLDSLRASHAIERRMGEALAMHLPRLDAKTIQDVSKRLHALPPGGSVATATVRMEEALLNWIVGEVKEAKDQESLLAFLSQVCGNKGESSEKNRAKGRAFLAESGGTKENILKCAEEMRQHSARMAKMLDLPPDQAAKEFEREEKALASNPVFKLFAPVLQNVLRRQMQANVRRALLSAALDIQLNGRDVLKNHPDPVGGSPFDYAAFEGGFELRSKEKSDNEPVVLTVGQRTK
ncbi:MAG TPA: sigma-70 family RNA polymerase sigma factor [Gemmataceae bacterium]|jgi:RNA polymerase sigma factor (sigma-70 family)